ncbi:hypothetical protein [Mesorhizobium sp. WSM4935]|uniref:hypothetical protein n=1 Tax=Mesorhizobium sp. WSM4935 TaxID=3038547 RepID=UPI0024152496|nr:hypothetical protein [Mesorhizobium sp. WSM4935]
MLTADGVIRNARAAAEKLPASTTRTNTSISPERLMSALAIRESISQKMCLMQGWFTAWQITIFSVHDPGKWKPVFGKDHAPAKIRGAGLASRS